MDCEAEITLCHGSVLARDLLALLDGEATTVRERCPLCIERLALRVEAGDPEAFEPHPS